MRLSKLHIYGYGKWSNKIIDLTEDLVVFTGHNEAGKSTLQSFIKSILFGFPTARKKDINQYIPKTDTQYGGQIVLEDTQYGTVIVERVRQLKGSASGILTIKNEKGDTLPDNVLDDILGNVTQDIYDSFYALQLSHLQELTKVDANDLNRYFLTIGTSGSDTLYQLRDMWLSKAQGLYKQSGSNPLLNQKLTLLKKLDEKLQYLQNQQETYAQLLADRQDVLSSKEELFQKETALKQDIQSIEKGLALYGILVESQQIELEYGQFKSVSIPEHAKETLQKIDEQIAYYDKQLGTLKQRTVSATQEVDLTWYKEQAHLIKQTIQLLPKIEQFMQVLLKSDYEKSVKEDALLLECQRFDIDRLPNEAYQKDDTFEMLCQEEEAISQERIPLEEQIKTLKQRLLDKQDRLEQLRKSPISRLKQEKPSAIWWISALFGYILSIIAFVFMPVYIGILVAVLSSGLIAYFAVEQRHYYQAKKEQDTKKYYINEQIKEEEQRLNIEVTALKDLQNELRLLQDKQQIFENKAISFKQAYAIPEVLSLKQLKSLDYAYDLKHSLENIQAQQDMYHQQVQKWLASFSFYEQQYPLLETDLDDVSHLRQVLTNFKKYVDTMNIVVAKEHQKSEQQKQLAYDIATLNQEITLLKTNRQHLLDEVGVKDTASFYEKVMLYEKAKRFLDRQVLLQEQLQSSTVDLSVYADKQAIEENLQQKQVYLNDIIRQQADVYKQLASVEESMKRLEKDGEYTQVLQEYTSLKDEVYDLMSEVGSYLLSARFIEMLLSVGTSGHLDDLLVEASKLFAKLTHQRYVALTFDKETIRVVKANSDVYLLHELSQGTLEQLYVSLRFAFIRYISSRLSLPVLIDDSFVNFDKTRLTVVYELLEDLSKTNQVLYFTFDTDIENQLKEKVQIERLHA
ncbi:AAA family ATPase [Carnobacteriaceae bacterium zg-84]|uniref:AAA family ATPase n=1 Tax=Granulicatella sp. zg-84 TaxID=2678503 RepID=UPI0013C1F89C|nr:AAA family ATPase [Granulicatella sp. zg-84]NEW65845.1 AAA family ATPase [Granulicatella sp. zg-84]QMI86382.1 AAA family ATPase [Carnobacteriaceae bacterium zg-84]